MCCGGQYDPAKDVLAEKYITIHLPVDLIIMDKFDANRRRLLALGGAALGAAAILPAPAFATLSTPTAYFDAE